MSEIYKVCLVGCGRMGATIDDEIVGHHNEFLWVPFSHAAAVLSCHRTHLVAVSDVIEEKAKTVCKRYQAERYYTDYRQMIEQENPDILCIATRPSSRSEITIFAAENGVKGIYAEKPLCCSMEEADMMVEVVQAHNIKFNYGTQRRFMPFFRQIRLLIDEGQIGNIQCVIFQYGMSSALWGLTHTADMMLFMAGDPEVDFVQGSILCQESDWMGNRLNTDPPVTNSYIRFSNGVHGYSTVGMGSEFEVSGTNGKLRILNDGLDAQLRRVSEIDGTLDEVEFSKIDRKSGTLMGILDIAEALDQNTETKGPIYLARRSQEIMMATIESHRLGGVRVSLPLENRSLYVGRPDW